MHLAFDYDYIERAAIMEYDGGLSRSEAEQRAWQIVYRKVEKVIKRDGSVEFKHILTANKPPAPKAAPVEEQMELISREQYLAGIKRYLRD